MVGAATAAGAANGEQESAAWQSASEADSVMGHPFHEGRMWLRPESGLLAWGSSPRLPGEPSAPRWLDATALRPVTVAGPRRILTGLPSTTGR